MRISGFHVDGFGTLADFGIEDLSPGLVILSGPNEAGKSTLHGLLHGYVVRLPEPPGQSPVPRAPCEADVTAGGSLCAREATSTTTPEPWRVERYAQPRRESRDKAPRRRRGLGGRPAPSASAGRTRPSSGQCSQSI